MAKQTIGEFLATLRKANGYTQQEVADRLGISNRTLSGWECSNVLPDILLLPVLAELYGVTVDEILAGERTDRNEVDLSSKSEKRIFKSKIAKFSAQCWLLLGLIVIGVALATACVVLDESTLRQYGFLWWLALLSGIILAAVCLAILFAFWKGAELFGEDASCDYGAYCLILRRKIANCLLIIAGENAVAATVFVCMLFARNGAFHFGYIFACVAFALVAVALFATGWLLYKKALIKFGGEVAQESMTKNRRYFWTVGFWGMIPIILSVIMAIVLGCVKFEDKTTTIYRSKSTEEFVAHMETLQGVDTQYHFPLSEIAKTAQAGQRFDLGNGFTAVYYEDSFTIYNKQIILINGDGTELKTDFFSITVPRIYLLDDEGVVCCYNVRYWYHFDEALGDSSSQLGHYTYERVGNGIAYIQTVPHKNYSVIGYTVASVVIVADLIVCLTLCVLKRNKFAVKL